MKLPPKWQQVIHNALKATTTEDNVTKVYDFELVKRQWKLCALAETIGNSSGYQTFWPAVFP